MTRLAPGIAVRRPVPADADRVAELVRAYDAAHGLPPLVGADDIRHEWRDADLERDAWLFEAEGRVAAYATAFGWGDDRVEVDGYVHPGFRGRGVGAEILRLSEERARERGARRVHNATLHADERARELLEGRGYAYVRSFFVMGIELDEAPPEPVVPDGLELASLTDADDEAVHAAIEEAFVDHWEHVPRPFDAWRRRREGADRSLWFAVRDGGELAGVCVNDLERLGGGWVGTLATRRPWRGRGVAQALLLGSFRELFRRGQRTVRLGVDASNPTGAVRLYERVGMRVVLRADVFEKCL